MEISYWLLLILVGLIALFIGYLIGKKQAPKGDTENLGAVKDRNNTLEKELQQCREKVSSLQGELAGYTTSFNPQEAREAMGKKVHENDLKLIEGIGPKIESLFHNFDIRSWGDLAGCSVEKCNEVLASGGDRYRLHDPSSWPMQAMMAHQGEWKNLARWQEEHKHGKL